MSLLDHFSTELDELKQQGNFRQFTQNVQHGRFITIQNKTMLNLASNDYLGLAADINLRQEFLDSFPIERSYFSSSSSRLLTGNFDEYEQLENSLSQAFGGRAALLFNSGYHMNIGILPAIADSKTLILADKLVHASMIDGIRLSGAQYVRYRHNDLQHLEQLLQKYHDDDKIERIIVVTESIFSMDGDETDLAALVQLKKRFAKTMLYVDEAHSIGVRGQQGLGCAEQYNVIQEIDFLVGTLGKALAAVGGYIICDPIIKDYLINKMRPLIFSTAQPPIVMAWANFIFQKVLLAQSQREHLKNISQYLQQAVVQKGYDSPSTSHIIPVIVGESQAAIDKAMQVQASGFYAMPVRPPTVPKNSSRLRISLTSMVQQHELEELVSFL
ncbi:8-amino-7-oxononanoate synthase [Acinetobacter pittii]|uniref:8-amino-7-oxononanoate synthase n=1 Tax=Acinetobacter pittii TaxID=48296 RepID=UPI0021CD7F8E|nr:8-amino-7-oxononanoate synthase [Acinetobacter pittii]MCU4401466.1 8-amino-7-oxononanoate synthase [Acinetobacter pittii]MCU4404570.1 8-amino-7-oxononanoate synthase [Acinetobacter pittii]MCU4464940.1 8-amino-7-oxononanoate synthase [Acinetobacter pittii]